LVLAALDEDIGEGDRTSERTIPDDQESSAVIVAKESVVVSGSPAVLEVFGSVDPELSVMPHAVDGDHLEAGDVVFSIRGRTRSILRGERVALNFLAHLSGVATTTARYMERMTGTAAQILDTRKTTPGWRVLEKAAVCHGGGTNHRFGLDDMILIKDNHVAAAGGVAEAVRRARAGKGDPLEVEIEVSDLDSLRAVLPLEPDRVLLDNMSVDLLREAVDIRRSTGSVRPALEASGNVTMETIRAIAETGVDYVSVGALTHSAPAADFSLRIMESS